MKIQKFLMVCFLTTILANCDKDNSNGMENQSNTTNNSAKIPPQSNSIIESKKVLNEAINSLNNVDKEFQWRDTHLLVQESQNAIKDEKYTLSIGLSQKVIQQTKLMHEQQDFADKNWQSFIPNVDPK